MPLMREYYIIFRALRLLIGMLYCMAHNTPFNDAQHKAYREVSDLLTEEIERK